MFSTITGAEYAGRVAAAMCDVTVIFGWDQNRWVSGRGSILNTSSVAWPI